MMIGITVLFMLGIITVMLIIGTVVCCLRNRCRRFFSRHGLWHDHDSLEFHHPVGK